MGEPLVFDQEHYVRIVEARSQFIRRLVPELATALELRTALDVGCGVGFFAEVLHQCGFDVRGFDGRESNVNEAATRYPGITFLVHDIQDGDIALLGHFDLVLCFGLLYHLENPMLSIRNLRSLTSGLLILETMCLPSRQLIAALRHEPNVVDQSLTDAAFYPTESCAVKMLYRAGFSHVYRAEPLPDHEDFRETSTHFRKRTALIAAGREIVLKGLTFVGEPGDSGDPWLKVPESGTGLRQRLRRFFAKPSREKISAIRRRLPFPHKKRDTITLGCGARWQVRDDHVSKPIREGRFEVLETSFAERFLRPGMVVLDIGAHHGFHSLLASFRVGNSGRVVSFEPSQRERKALVENIRLNRCRNVRVEGLALGAESKYGRLHVVEGTETGCNSLAPPKTLSGTSLQRVRIVRLDDWLAEHRIERVDFVKLDVEGGERDVLAGAERLLTSSSRPVLLVEVQDLRTAPWGYRAKEIVERLSRLSYEWFDLLEGGCLRSLDASRDSFDGNFVACPHERIPEMSHIISASVVVHRHLGVSGE